MSWTVKCSSRDGLAGPPEITQKFDQSQQPKYTLDGSTCIITGDRDQPIMLVNIHDYTVVMTKDTEESE